MDESETPSRKPRSRSPNTVHQGRLLNTVYWDSPPSTTIDIDTHNKTPKSILKSSGHQSRSPVKSSRCVNIDLFCGHQPFQTTINKSLSASPVRVSRQKYNSNTALRSRSNTPNTIRRTSPPKIKTYEVDLFNLESNRSSRNSKIDISLYSWLKEEKTKGHPVSTHDLQIKARQINLMLNGEPNFAASNGWLNRWKKRVGVTQFDDNFEIDDKSKNMYEPSLETMFADEGHEYRYNQNTPSKETKEKLIPKKNSTTLLIEPFFGGSHKQLIETLLKEFYEDCQLITLPAKKWHWRARCSALRLSQIIPDAKPYKVLFCSSVLNLAELLGLRPDLRDLKKVVYFHENQLTYPKREVKKRDFQFGYNQITTCLVADTVVFNSIYNMNTFLMNLESYVKMMPDCRPKDLVKKIKPKSTVLYFPIYLPSLPWLHKSYDVLHIIWPHRWEYDKGPDEFFDVLFRLKSGKVKFKLSVLGEKFSEVPEVFNIAKEALKSEIINWGYLQSREDYFSVLRKGHVVVSTARHEFYGVAMLEAVHHGCFPLVPNRLVYPEIYDKSCIYKNDKELFYKLKTYCYNPLLVKDDYNKLQLDFNVKKYSTEALLPEFKKLLLID